MLKVNLIRHAKTEANIKKQFCGSMETNVVESMIDINNKIFSKLKKDELGKVFSSPSKRAIFTANTISNEVEILDFFREINFGDFEGKTFDEIKEKFPDEIEKWNNDNMNYKFPNGESIVEFYNRCAMGIGKIIFENKNENNITIFTHGGVIQSIIAYLLDDNIDLFWKFKVDNCSLTTFKVDNDNIIFECINM